MTTEVLGFDELTSGQANKFVVYNQNLRQLEAMTVRVLSRTNGGPPGSPVEGDAYIIDAVSGDWSSFTLNHIAHYIGGDWTQYTPTEGVRLWVNDEDVLVGYNGSIWDQLGINLSSFNDGEILFVVGNQLTSDPGFLFDVANQCLQAPDIETTNLPGITTKGLTDDILPGFSEPAGTTTLYTMDDVTSDVAVVDEQGNQNGIHNGVLALSTGLGGNAVDLPGSAGEYIDFDGALSGISSGYALSLWVNIGSLPATTEVIYQSGEVLNPSWPTEGQVTLLLNSSGVLVVQAVSTTGGVDAGIAGSVNLTGSGTFRHLVINIGAGGEANGIKLYLDGQEIGSNIALPLDAGLSFTRLGARGDDTGNFDGLVDQLRHWSRQLTLVEIQDLYQEFITYSEPTTQLQHKYTFDNVAATSLPDLIGSNDGVVNGATPTTGSGGKDGEALDFDGTNDFVEFNSTIASPTDISISMWVERDSVSSNEALWALNNNPYTGSNNRITFQITSSDELRAIVADQGTFTSSAVSWTAAYHHVALVIEDGAGVRMYFDGVEVLNTSMGTMGVTNQDKMWLGGINNGSLDGVTIPFNGRIDQLRVWHKALTAGEVTELDEEFDNPFTEPTGTILHYDMEPTTVILDEQGNQNGTLEGSTTLGPGTDGNAAIFNDSLGGLVNINGALPGTLSQFSASFITSIDSLVSTAYFIYFSEDNPFTGTSDNFSIRTVPGSGAFAIALRTDLGIDALLTTPAGSLVVGQTYHVTVTVGATDTKAYINGVEVGSIASPSGNYVMPFAAIGNSVMGSNPLDGYMDQVRFWDRELTSTESSQLYREFNTFTEPATPINHYTFDNIIQGAINDGVGSADAELTGTLTQAAAKDNQGLVLDGSTHLTINPSIFDVSQFSMSFWIDTSDNDVGIYNSETAQGEFEIHLSGTNLRATYKDSTASEVFAEVASFSPTSGLKHVVVIYDSIADNLEIFVDGVSSATQSLAGLGGLGTVISPNNYIGAISDGSGNPVSKLTGTLDHIRFFSGTALTSAQAIELFYEFDGGTPILGTTDSLRAKLDDNKAGALKVVEEGSGTEYLTVDTTDGSEQVNIKQALSLGTNKATSTYIPSSGEDLTNKTYVDSVAGGAGLAPFQIITSNYTASAGDRLFVNTAGGPVTITLPVTPSLNDSVSVVDITALSGITGGVPAGPLINIITIDRNGELINEEAQNGTIEDGGVSSEFVFSNSALGWRVLQ